MANVDRPGGFKPVGNVLTGAYNGQSREYYVDGTDTTNNLFVGDAVKSGGSADDNGVASVAQCAAGERMVGVIVGIKVPDPYGKEAHPGYIPSGTTGYVRVADDPNTIFEVQADEGGTALVAGDVGNNSDHIAGAGSTITGGSAFELNADPTTATSAQWRILGFSQRIGNEPYSENPKVLVKPNEHEWLGSAAAGPSGV